MGVNWERGGSRARWRAAFSVALALAVLALSDAALAQTRTTVRVSVSAAGEEDASPTAPNASPPASEDVSLSADGRYIAFQSRAQLTPDDVDTASDIYLRDRLNGTLTRIGPGFAPSISGDGRFVAFATAFSRFASPPSDIRLYDANLKTTRVLLIAVPPIASDPCAGCVPVLSDPELSYDGRYLAFVGTTVRGYVNGSITGLLTRSETYRYDVVSQTTIRVSVKTGGQEATGTATCDVAHVIETDLFCGSGGQMSVSDDGRFVAFNTTYDLVAGDTNLVRDVYVHDVVTRTTTLESARAGGGSADGRSFGVSMSGNARYVVFDSTASNIVSYTPYNSQVSQVFLRDRQTGTTVLLTRTAAGLAADKSSSAAVISGNGRYVSLTSAATNLSGAELAPNEIPAASSLLYVANLTLAPGGTVTGASFGKASVASDATPGAAPPPQVPINGFNGWISDLSDDGRFIAFVSSATTLVTNDNNGATDVFLHDHNAYFVARTRNDAAAFVDMREAAVSGNGRYVAFASPMSTLVPGDTNGVSDIFVRDRLSGALARVSIASTGQQGNGASGTPKISAEGRFVVFASAASNLVAGDTNAVSDIFLHDRDVDQNGIFDEPGKVLTVRVSLGPGGAQANGRSIEPAFSEDGRIVAFTSAASNLVAGDSNPFDDIFVYDVRLRLTTRVSVNTMNGGVGEANGPSSQPGLSESGRYVVFSSLASNLVSGGTCPGGGKMDDFLTCVQPDTNAQQDVFLHDRAGLSGCRSGCTAPRLAGGATVRVSLDTGNFFSSPLELNGPSENGSVSETIGLGRLGSGQVAVVYATRATNLAGIFPPLGDPNGPLSDVVLRNMFKGDTIPLTRGANGASTKPVISRSGAVVFSSTASNLVFRDTNTVEDVFVLCSSFLWVAPDCALSGFGTNRVSANDFAEGAARSYDPAVSADGKVVAFTTEATTLPNGLAGGASAAALRAGPGIEANDGGGNGTEIIYRGKTPEVTDMTPDHGSIDGGDSLVVLGRNLDREWLQNKVMMLGDVPVADLAFLSDSTLGGRTGRALQPGAVDAIVFDANGNAAARLPSRFTYQAPAAPTPSDPTPPPVGCPDDTYAVSPTLRSVDANRQTLTIAVTAGTACSWAAVSESNSPWLRLVGATDVGGVTSLTGQGIRSLTYEVLANDTGIARTGHIRVHTRIVTITQADAASGAPAPKPEVCDNGFDDDGDGLIDEGCAACTYSLSGPGLPVGSGGGTASFTVFANKTECTWTAVSQAGFVTLTSPETTSGTAAVSFTVASNPAATVRTGILVVAGQTFTVTQAGACFFSVSVSSGLLPSRASTTALPVTTGPACGWSAQAVGTIATIVGGATGTGNGTVMIDVPVNPTARPRLIGLLVGNTFFTLVQGGAVPTDLEGDGKGDLVVWRPPSGIWFSVHSGTAYDSAKSGALQWGLESVGDQPLMGDMDGDAIADLVVWRATTGTWYWLKSSAGSTYATAALKQWGDQRLGDVPLLGDIDGDGKADLVIWRASTGTWFWLTSSSGYDYAAAGVKQWGDQRFGDIPKLGDVDGDGKADLVIWRAATGDWYWLTSSAGYSYAAAGTRRWGDQTLGDVPLLSDLDGDGRADLVVWRASDGTWYWLTSASGYVGGGLKRWGSGSPLNRDIPMVK